VQLSFLPSIQAPGLLDAVQPSLREREVMSLVVSGMLNKQIAAELGASEATVKMHRSQVMKKMPAKILA